MSNDVRTVRRSTRLVLVVGIGAGFLYGASLAVFSPEQYSLASDVYYYAADAVLAGENPYDAPPPDLPDRTYLYPPVVLWLFVPHAKLGHPATAYALQTAINVGAALALAGVLVRALERRAVALEWLDRTLIAAFTLASVFGIQQVVMGQLTLWLGLAFALGFDWLETGRERLAGVALAFAAIVKVFPAAIGLWLLRERHYDTVAIATATGITAMAVGWLTLGADLTVHYFGEVLLGRYHHATFEGVPDPGRGLTTGRRQVATLLGGGSPLVTPVTALLLGGILAVVYRSIDTDRQRLAGILATVVAALLFTPLQPLYFPLAFYPLVVLLYVLPPGRARRALIAGTVVSYSMVDLRTLVLLVGSLGLPVGLEETLLHLVTTVLTFVQVPTIGMWLLLFACVFVVTDRG